MKALLTESVIGKACGLGLGVMGGVIFPAAAAGVAIAGAISFKDLCDLAGTALGALGLKTFQDKNKERLKTSFGRINADLAKDAALDLAATLADSQAVEAFYSEGLLDYRTSLSDMAKLKESLGNSPAESLSLAILKPIETFQALSATQKDLALKVLTAVIDIALRDPEISRDYQNAIAHDTNKAVKENSNELAELSAKVDLLLKNQGLGQAVEEPEKHKKIRNMIERLQKEGKEEDDILKAVEEFARGFIYDEERKTNLGLEHEIARQKSRDRIMLDGRVGLASEPLLKRREALAEEAKRQEIAVLDDAINIEKLDRNFSGAVDLILERLMCEQGEVSFDALQVEWEDWYEKGLNERLNLELEVAILLARESLNRASTPDDKGAALNDLGVTLTGLGEREAVTERLEEAVKAHKQALVERTRERVPLDWAGTQLNLGNALMRLGQRKADSKRLNEAVEAYRLALLEWTRERVPLQWAMTQNNLGNALRNLGEREDGPVKQLGLFIQAVEALRLALLVWTRERVPLKWATTQNNLGNTLSILGKIEANPVKALGRLNEAIEAYADALLELTRERVPLQWATTQNNLGLVLWNLGEREADSVKALGSLDEAVEAYRNALLERTHERMPFDWAGTQNNLALLYREYYHKTQKRSHLQTALTHARAALEVFEQAGADYYFTNCKNLIANLEAL